MYTYVCIYYHMYKYIKMKLMCMHRKKDSKVGISRTVHHFRILKTDSESDPKLPAERSKMQFRKFSPAKFPSGVSS